MQIDVLRPSELPASAMAAKALPLGPVSALPGKAMRRIDLIRGSR